MRAPEFSDEQIIEAGKALVKEGKQRITGFGLQEKLGGGNSKRLKVVWDKYCMNSAESLEVSASDLPPEVLESFEKFLKNISSQFLSQIFDLNEKANRVADRKLTEVLQASAEQRAQNEAEVNDASKIIEALEATNVGLKSDCAEKAATIIKVQAMAQAQAVELAQMRERLSAAEQTTVVERLHYQDELAQARMEAAQARACLAEAQTDAVKAREDAAKLAGKVEAIEAQRAELLKVLASRSEPTPSEPAKPKKSDIKTS